MLPLACALRQVDGRLVYCTDGCLIGQGEGALVGDEAGRITFYGRREADEESIRGDKLVFDEPKWQLEQYFSTDYNAVRYDAQGLPVDEGSGMPVHRAPQGARTNHRQEPQHDAEEMEEGWRPEPLAPPVVRKWGGVSWASKGKQGETWEGASWVLLASNVM